MYFRKQPVLLSATVNGSIARLVSITAGAAYLSPLAAIAVGFTGGVFYLLAVNLLDRLQLDDVDRQSLFRVRYWLGSRQIALWSIS
ncbi:hypothetical protein [Methylobacter sp.]|jgi:Amt family ammonium transporter|uniref:hypothetical protein n=1 Tax=Methylobacter sp. TaxID=2051955 RepID=UPI003DA3FA98